MLPLVSQNLTATDWRQACRCFLKQLITNETGSALVEFSLLAPLLIMLWVGAMQFSPLLRDQIILQAAAHQGAQVLAAGRTDANVYSDVQNAVSVAAGSMSSGLTVSLSICNSGGSSCSACQASTCANVLQSAAGDAAQVSVSYPCSLTYALFNLSASCTLSASESVLVE